MTRTLLIAATAASLAFAANAAPPSDADRASLQATAERLDRVWDAGDAAAVAAMYADDGSVRLDNRPFVQGRDAVLRYFQETIGRRPAGARHRTWFQNVDMLTPDLALVDAHVRIERVGPSGQTETLADFHNQTVAQRDGDTWRFRVVRAQRMATPPPR